MASRHEATIGFPLTKRDGFSKNNGQLEEKEIVKMQTMHSRH